MLVWSYAKIPRRNLSPEENARLLSIYMRPWTLNPVDVTARCPLLSDMGIVAHLETKRGPSENASSFDNSNNLTTSRASTSTSLFGSTAANNNRTASAKGAVSVVPVELSSQTSASTEGNIASTAHQPDAKRRKKEAVLEAVNLSVLNEATTTASRTRSY